MLQIATTPAQSMTTAAIEAEWNDLENELTNPEPDGGSAYIDALEDRVADLTAEWREREAFTAAALARAESPVREYFSAHD